MTVVVAVEHLDGSSSMAHYHDHEGKCKWVHHAFGDKPIGDTPMAERAKQLRQVTKHYFQGKSQGVDPFFVMAVLNLLFSPSPKFNSFFFLLIVLLPLFLCLFLMEKDSPPHNSFLDYINDPFAFLFIKLLGV
jgi:hypothetical protein